MPPVEQPRVSFTFSAVTPRKLIPLSSCRYLARPLTSLREMSDLFVTYLILCNVKVELTARKSPVRKERWNMRHECSLWTLPELVINANSSHSLSSPPYYVLSNAEGGKWSTVILWQRAINGRHYQWLHEWRARLYKRTRLRVLTGRWYSVIPVPYTSLSVCGTVVCVCGGIDGESRS